MIFGKLFLTLLASTTKMKSLDNYLNRIGVSLEKPFKCNEATLATIMDGQSRSISFENFDVVMKKTISMKDDDVEAKLVDQKRGGYCWELNTLLRIALEDMGYKKVTPLLCRVRWGKPDDSLEPNTAYTHLALKVETDDGRNLLADVGFAGSNSMAPVSMDVGDDPQELPEGRFRIVPSKHDGFHVLEVSVKEEWKPLYEWRDEHAPFVDQECSNWFSCTYPSARFTTQIFAHTIIGEERHYILNEKYFIRKGHGVDKEIKEETIEGKSRLLELIENVFGVELKETDGIDRYLQ